MWVVFFYYTFVSSVFILVAVFYILFTLGSLSFLNLCFISNIPFSQNFVICNFLFFGFLSKIPCFPLHIWLLEAHVEAPLAVSSVILVSYSVLLMSSRYDLRSS